MTRETTVRRINQWCRPVIEGEAVTETFELPSFLEGAVALDLRQQPYPPLQAGQYKIIDPAFAYMVLGQYPAQATNQLISREWIYKARERWDAYVRERGQRPPDHIKAVIGLDVAEMGQDSNAMCVRYGGDVEPIVTWGGMDIMQTGDRAAGEFRGRQADRVNVDATGVGAGVAPHLTRLSIPAVAVKVASSPTDKTEMGEFKILRDQIWWATREWLRTDPGAMLPPDETLIEELQTPTYQIEGGKIRVMNKDTMKELLKRSPDRAESVILTFAPTGFFTGRHFSFE
uniref:Putative terminase n=1 Tax=viral metagenome TaxID=1070528 RepID=A0A6M3JU91_9ZZZZ